MTTTSLIKRRNKINRILKIIFMVLSVLFLLWITVSFFNVISNNTSARSTTNIWEWNFFTILENIYNTIKK